MRTTDWHIIGAQAYWTGRAPFLRAKPIVQALGENALVRDYNEELCPVPYDYMLLQMSDPNACLFFGHWPLERYAEVWLFRPNFPFLQEAMTDLRNSGSLLYGPHVKEPMGVTWAIVRMDSAAQADLQEWCDTAADMAIDHGAREEWLRAVDCASLSFSLCDAPNRVGLYLSILELSGDQGWSASTQDMVKATKGDDFLQSCLTEKRRTDEEIFRRRSLLVTKD